MRARAIGHEQTNAVAVMGTVIKSERTRPFMPETARYFATAYLGTNEPLSSDINLHVEFQWGLNEAFN